jgi:hypothetical protein
MLEVSGIGTNKDDGTISRKYLRSLHCRGKQKKRAQRPTVATEYIGRTTRYTNVFTRVEHLHNLTPNRTL